MPGLWPPHLQEQQWGRHFYLSQPAWLSPGADASCDTGRCRLEGERVDMWVVRFNNEAPLHYWGLKQMGERETEGAMELARSVLFVGGARPQPSASVRDVVAWYPQLDQRKVQQVGPRL